MLVDTDAGFWQQTWWDELAWSRHGQVLRTLRAPDLRRLRRPLVQCAKWLPGSNGATGMRFPSLQWHGIEAGVYLQCGRNYTLQSVNAKHRPRVRKGMETFEVRQVPVEVLLQQGIQLNRDTMRKTDLTAATTSGPVYSLSHHTPRELCKSPPQAVLVTYGPPAP
jgi:hypothetical protein